MEQMPCPACGAGVVCGVLVCRYCGRYLFYNATPKEEYEAFILGGFLSVVGFVVLLGSGLSLVGVNRVSMAVNSGLRGIGWLVASLVLVFVAGGAWNRARVVKKFKDMVRFRDRG